MEREQLSLKGLATDQVEEDSRELRRENARRSLSHLSGRTLETNARTFRSTPFASQGKKLCRFRPEYDR